MKTTQISLKAFVIVLNVIFTIFWCIDTYAQVGINTLTPNSSSMLDINATDKGLLIPRMTSAQRLAIVTPATGLMVYETTTSQFFYFDGTVWRPLASNGSDWNIAGNTGTVAGTNFIGTTDAKDFVMKTNNLEQMRISTGGNVGLGTATPVERLQVSGKLLLTNGFSSDNAAVIYNNNSDYLFLGPRSGTTTNGAAISLFGSTNNIASNPNGIDFNTSVTSPTMRILANGNIGIGGIAVPTDRLHVAGNIRMVDGNQGAGKVLVSDANGRGTWQTLGTATNAWGITGNAGTNAATNFIGTTDNVPFSLRVNNQPSGSINHLNQNLFLGFNAGLSNTTSANNTFIGDSAGRSNIVGTRVTIVGAGAGVLNNALNNSFFGADAGRSNTTGIDNAFFGSGSGESNVTGINNAIFGDDAGKVNVSGSGNSFFGADAGISSTGGNNTFIGFNANGTAGITGSVAIGANAIVTASNSMVFGNGQNVGIGVTAPLVKLDVNGAVAFGDNSATVSTSSLTLTVGNKSYIRITSTSGLIGSVPLTLTDGLQVGQMLFIEDVAGAVRIVDNAVTNNTELAITRDLGPADTIQLIWNGTSWLEVGFTNN